jgi:hypothetical protein
MSGVVRKGSRDNFDAVFSQVPGTEFRDIKGPVAPGCGNLFGRLVLRSINGKACQVIASRVKGLGARQGADAWVVMIRLRWNAPIEDLVVFNGFPPVGHLSDSQKAPFDEMTVLEQQEFSGPIFIYLQRCERVAFGELEGDPACTVGHHALRRY